MVCLCHLSNVYGNRSDVASLFLLLTICVFFFFPPKKGPAHDPRLTFLLLVSPYGWDLWGPGDHLHEPTLPFWDHAWTLRLQRSHTDPADSRACTDPLKGRLWAHLVPHGQLRGSCGWGCGQSLDWHAPHGMGWCWGGGQGLCPHHPIFRHWCSRSLWLLNLNLTFFVVRG